MDHVYDCECGWTGTEEQMDPINNIFKRVTTGELMAPGCCPECGDLISVADPDVPDHTVQACIEIARARGMI